MATLPDLSHPPDICLLLRAYAEQRWLTSELEPHLRELERAHAIPDEQLGAALAYLEVLWLDARGRAAETDAAFHCLDPEPSERCQLLRERARRYYLAVRRLRGQLEGRVRGLTSPQERAQNAWCSPG
jgi:hypothetical protein